MALIYRGQTAQPSATVNTVDTGMTGTFLGRSYSIRTSQQPAQRAAKLLQFRGNAY